jgi:hypothetical protein
MMTELRITVRALRCMSSKIFIEVFTVVELVGYTEDGCKNQNGFLQILAATRRTLPTLQAKILTKWLGITLSCCLKSTHPFCCKLGAGAGTRAQV